MTITVQQYEPRRINFTDDRAYLEAKKQAEAFNQLLDDLLDFFLKDIPYVPTYTVATVPTVGDTPRGIIYVSDETGGATLAFSDGTNWRRVQDRAIVA